MQLQQNSIEAIPPFQLTFHEPYSTFEENGTPREIDFVVNGLLTAGGVSILGAKPKVGKSSLSRYLAVCIASGAPFLERETTKGDVLLISLEDNLRHVDNCLNALGYDPSKHAAIRTLDRVFDDPRLTVQELRKRLPEMPDLKLIVIDHLAHFLNAKDLNDYMPVHRGFSQLRELTNDFPGLHVLCLAHAKKAQCDDPFDTILGTTALRGLPDTNIVMLNEKGQRAIVAETRIGRSMQPTILKTDLTERGGADVVRGYEVGESLHQWEASRKEQADAKQVMSYSRRVVDHLASCDDHKALQKDLVQHVKGKSERIIEAIKELEEKGLISASGTPRELTLHLDGDALALYRMG